MFNLQSLLGALSPEALQRLMRGQGAQPPQAMPMQAPPPQASPIAPSLADIGMQIPGAQELPMPTANKVRGDARKSAFMQAAMQAIGNIGNRGRRNQPQQGGSLVGDRPGAFIN